MAVRYQSLDAWRGLACLLVVVFHGGAYAFFQSTPDGSFTGLLLAATGRLWIGVPLFFVISGYCIAASADATRQRGAPGRAFFVRRFRRIYPPYWAILGLTALVTIGVERWLAPGLLVGDFGPLISLQFPQSLDPRQWFGVLTLTETWRPLYWPGSPSNLFLGQAWTLCYEEQFYFVTGLVLLLRPAWFFPAIAVITVAVAVWSGVSPRWGIDSHGLFIDGRWLMFAAGIGVYYAIQYPARWSGRIIRGALMAGAAVAARDPRSFLVQEWFFPNPDGKEPFVAYAFALLLLGLHRWDAALARSVPLAPFRFLGRICYSMYLVHYPICVGLGHGLFRAGYSSPAETVLITVPACIALSVALGWAFHHAVEKRFTNIPSAPFFRNGHR